MFNIAILISVLVIIILLIINVILSAKNNTGKWNEIKLQLEHTKLNRKDAEQKLKEESALGRADAAQSARDLRMEVMQQVSGLSKTLSESMSSAADMQYKQLHQFSEQLYKLTHSGTERFAVFQNNIDIHNAESRKELKLQLDVFKSELNVALKDYKEKLRENFSDFEKNQTLSHSHTGEKLVDIKKALEASIKTLQQSNELRLEDMRRTVDEKLNVTLERRLGESFKLVSERLEAVHKGLGDMQHLALSVGDLKKVMSNVKSRGIIGEYQLQNILEDLLTNEQYARNVKTKRGSGAIVEFAIKMPHGNNLEQTLWLPIDAKFPREDYELLVQAYEDGNPEQVEICRKAFSQGIKKNAQDIKEKYIDPPNTTEYGIMFLPFESLFAEVLRIPGLFEKLQKEYKVIITGPTTLSALLNSLQMGFRTLAIEKRSTEVWDLLHVVKSEFNQFGILLDKTKKKLDEASHVIENAGIRTRAIQRKLNKVELIPDEKLLPMPENNENDNSEMQT
jgi:DNA recombination protein RmuC